MRYCTNCGSKLNEQEKFCSNCGSLNECQQDASKFYKKPNSKAPNFLIISALIIVLLLVVFSLPSLLKTRTEKRGNSVGNIVNFGFAAQQGNWIYFSKMEKDLILYKIRSDGTNEQRIIDDKCVFLNVVDQWIYYTIIDDGNGLNIYKIRTDGTNRTKLNEDESAYLNVVGQWIYYANVSDNSNIYKIRTDGTQRTKLNEDDSLDLNVIGNWIFYQNESDNNKIYKISTDGRNRTKLNDDDSRYLNVIGNWIYYQNWSDSRNIYKIRTDGTNRTKLNEDDSVYLNVVDQWIYYANVSDNSSIYKIRTDGTKRTKIIDERAGSINVVGNWIYWVNEEGTFRININEAHKDSHSTPGFYKDNDGDVGQKDDMFRLDDENKDSYSVSEDSEKEKTVSRIIPKDQARDIGSWSLEVVANSGVFGISEEVDIQRLLRRNDVNLVLIDFWATWCEPCKASMPYLDQVYKNYKEQGLATLLISVDVKNDYFYRRMMNDLEHLNVSYPIPWDYNSEVKNYLGVGAIPATFLVDKNGKIRYEHTGFTSEEIDIPPLRVAIEHLLNE